MTKYRIEVTNKETGRKHECVERFDSATMAEIFAASLEVEVLRHFSGSYDIDVEPVEG